MSSSFTYTFTKLRSRPSSVYRCFFSPSCWRVRSARSSPTVAPATSTASFLPVKGRSGVGMRTRFGMASAISGSKRGGRARERLLVERGAVVFEQPRRHRRGLAAHDGYDHVREHRPRVVQVVLGWTRRVIRVRVIEAEELEAASGRLALGRLVVGGADEEAPSRSFLRGVRQGERRRNLARGAEQRAAALVRERLLAVGLDGVGNARAERQRLAGHQLTPPTNEPSAGSSQNRSDRYLSPPSEKIATITPASTVRPILSAAASAAPDEMPTSSPCSTARRRVQS